MDGSVWAAQCRTLPFGIPGNDVSHQEQQREFELLKNLNQLSAVEYPQDSDLHDEAEDEAARV